MPVSRMALWQTVERNRNMNITYNEKNRIFKLDTPNTSYCIGVVDEENFLGHVYYGGLIHN